MRPRLLGQAWSAERWMAFTLFTESRPLRMRENSVAAHICRTRVCRAKPVACVSGRVTQRGLLPPRPARGVVGHLHGGLVMPIQEEACAPASRSVSDRSVDQLLGLRMSCAFAPPSSVLLILLCRCHDFHYTPPISGAVRRAEEMP
jgi:hypothetical protein